MEKRRSYKNWINFFILTISEETTLYIKFFRHFICCELFYLYWTTCTARRLCSKSCQSFVHLMPRLKGGGKTERVRETAADKTNCTPRNARLSTHLSAPPPSAFPQQSLVSQRFPVGDPQTRVTICLHAKLLQLPRTFPLLQCSLPQAQECCPAPVIPFSWAFSTTAVWLIISTSRWHFSRLSCMYVVSF